MPQYSGGTVPIESAKACVIYDPHTGRVHHIHQVITFKGGREPGSDEIEADALALVKSRGRVGRLEALHVPHDSLQPKRRYRVDLASRTLAGAETCGD